MVFKFDIWHRRRRSILVAGLVALQSATSFSGEGVRILNDAHQLYDRGQFFSAARYAFSALNEDPSVQTEAYAWITVSLIRAGLHQSASFFFIRTLQSGNRAAIRRVLSESEEMMIEVGADLLRPYLVQYTTREDYDPANRSAYLFAVGKDALLKDRAEDAISHLKGVSSDSPLRPFSLQLRATANSILGRTEAAIKDFQECQSSVGRYQKVAEADDLKARCQAGEARALYETGKFQESDRAYDLIPKGSIVWPDILFEQAWVAFGKGEYNRTLGRLVSYKSPALQFVFNTEVDVLRAQTYLNLCLYDDANATINEFHTKYSRLGEDVKRFIENNSDHLDAFYDIGKKALSAQLSTNNDFYRMMNRFVRSPYFKNTVKAEERISTEQQAIRQFGGGSNSNTGFPGFLGQVLRWRFHSIQMLGGSYVKNSLIDYHTILISDFEKIAFIKLEMLSRAKDKLLKIAGATDDRARGNRTPRRRDDQMFWNFNGEFWNDELGDYVFGLESECTK